MYGYADRYGVREGWGTGNSESNQLRPQYTTTAGATGSARMSAMLRHRSQPLARRQALTLPPSLSCRLRRATPRPRHSKTPRPRSSARRQAVCARGGVGGAEVDRSIVFTQPSRWDESLINDSFRPCSPEARTFSARDFAALWIGLVVGVPTYYLAAGHVALGMLWWQVRSPDGSDWSSHRYRLTLQRLRLIGNLDDPCS